METEHTEGVLEKALAFVKHTLRIPAHTPDVVANPEYIDTEPTSQDALDPSTYTTKSVAEVNLERARREHSATALNEHIKAAAQIDRAKVLAEEALDEIQDVSRDMREMYPGKTLSSKSEMDEFERAAENDHRVRQHTAGW